MHRRHKTPITYILILLVALAALWWGLGFATRDDDIRKGQDVNEGEQILDERGDDSIPPNDEQLTGTPATSAQIASILKVEANAAAYLTESRSQDSIARVWFADYTGMYVEYYRNSSNSADRMVFLGPDVDLQFSRLALYGQNESGGWELMEGEDVLFTKPQKDLYERNAEGEWVKIN